MVLLDLIVYFHNSDYDYVLFLPFFVWEGELCR